MRHSSSLRALSMGLSSLGLPSPSLPIDNAAAARMLHSEAFPEPSATLRPWSMLVAAAAFTGGISFAATALQDSTAEAKEAAVTAAPAAPAVDQTQPKGMTDVSDIVLYQYEVCPFCCKVKAVLDFYKLPYRVVEVDPLMKKEIKWSTYRKVPIIMIDGEQINDSSVIVQRLHNEMEAFKAKKSGAKSSKAPSPAQSLPLAKADDPSHESKWRAWVDSRFVSVVTVNIYRTAGEALQTFDYITDSGNFSWWNRSAAKFVGGAMMYLVSHRKLKAKYGITGDEREALYAAVDEFTEQALGSRPFVGGKQPSLADLSMFGVVRSIRTTATFKDMMARSPRLRAWFGEMEGRVGASSRRWDDDKFLPK